MSDACRCGAPAHESDPQRCAAGHVLAGNMAAATHGGWSYERGKGGPDALPPAMQQTAADFRAAVISDRGGDEHLTAIEGAYIRRLGELEVVARLIGADLARRGLMTPKGRVRPTFNRWLEVLDRWDRYAQRLGIDRKARQVPRLQDYLDQRAARMEGSE
jgi:hypothetical protein